MNDWKQTPWAIQKELRPWLAHLMRQELEVSAEVRAGIEADLEAAARGRRGQRIAGQVAVLSLRGLITPRGSFLSYLFGGGSGGLVAFREMFDEAVASSDVGAIVLDIDSPGGSSALVDETAAAIRAARGTKPIIAVADTLAASAAYWIAAQADEVVVTPSGYVGSVGVYYVHNDWSGFNEKVGIIPTYISAGKFKTDGNPDEPLSETAKAALQEMVDDCYAMFVSAVAAGRGVKEAAVRDGYGEGRVLPADRAVAAGLADRVDTLDSVITGLIGGGSGGPRTELPTPAPQPAGEPPAPETSAGDPAPGADADDQPRCACGKFVADGKTQCEECAKASAEADDTPDDPEANADEATLGAAFDLMFG